MIDMIFAFNFLYQKRLILNVSKYNWLLILLMSNQEDRTAIVTDTLFILHESISYELYVRNTSSVRFRENVPQKFYDRIPHCHIENRK